MSRIDFYFDAPPCEAIFQYTGADFARPGGDRSAVAVARRVADWIVIDDVHVADDTPESRAKFAKWFKQEDSEMERWNEVSNEARRLSPEKPYAVLTQHMWNGSYSKGPKLCTSLRTFATAAEAEKYAAEAATAKLNQVYYLINATAQLVREPPAPPPAKLHITVLSPGKRKRAKRKSRR